MFEQVGDSLKVAVNLPIMCMSLPLGQVPMGAFSGLCRADADVHLNSLKLHRHAPVGHVREAEPRTSGIRSDRDAPSGPPRRAGGRGDAHRAAGAGTGGRAQGGPKRVMPPKLCPGSIARRNCAVRVQAARRHPCEVAARRRPRLTRTNIGRDPRVVRAQIAEAAPSAPRPSPPPAGGCGDGPRAIATHSACVTGLAQQLTPTFRRAVNLLKTNFQHVFDVPPVGGYMGVLAFRPRTGSHAWRL